MKVYHKVRNYMSNHGREAQEYFEIEGDEMAYTYEEFVVALEHAGLTTEDFDVVLEPSMIEAIPDCIAIWEYKDG